MKPRVQLRTCRVAPTGRRLASPSRVCGGSMSSILPADIAVILLLAVVGLLVALAWRRRLVEQRRRDNQLDSVYARQLHRERKDHR